MPDHPSNEQYQDRRRLTVFRFYAGLVITVITIWASIWAAVTWGADRMRRDGEIHNVETIRREVRGPDGIILEAIEEQILANDIAKESEHDERFRKLERQTDRLEYMMSEIYQQVTGRQPPRKPE